jgi:hypothetical protein
MKDGGDPLDRLFRAAARATRPETAGASAAVEARVLSAWRAGAIGDFGAMLVFWLRRAVAMACVLVLLSAAWSLRQAAETTVDAASLADSAVQMALNHE